MHSSRRQVPRLAHALRTTAASLACALSLGSLLGCVDGNTSNGDATSGSATGVGSGTSSGGSSAQAGTGQGGAGNNSAGTGSGAGTSAAGSQSSSGGSSNPAGGSAGASTAGSGGAPPVVVFPPATRGATLTYLEYEAEDSATNGTVLGPSRKTAASNDVAAESSNRKAVQLNATGQYVKVTSTNPAN